MEYYFVDYENVNAAGLNGIVRLTEEDVVVIFYSENANTMTFGLHRRINASRAQIRFQKVLSGSRNALDFQLSSYLGYVICENAGKETTYYVVSRDRGYEVLTKYWKHQNVDVVIVSDLSPRPEPRPAVPRAKGGKDASGKEAGDGSGTPSGNGAAETPPVGLYTGDEAALVEALEKIIPDRSRIPTVARLLRTCPTRQKLHGELMREFHEGADNRGVTELYKSLKPLLADKP